MLFEMPSSEEVTVNDLLEISLHFQHRTDDESWSGLNGTNHIIYMIGAV